MKEQNELLEATLKLLNILNNVDDLSHDEWEVIGDVRTIVGQHQLREVVPVEWKPWTVEMVRNHRNFQETADLHNAEMERVTK
jgi:hypothetical protein